MKLSFSNFFACILYTFVLLKLYYIVRSRRDRMVVGFATNCAISAYPHYSCELKSHSRKVFSIQRLQGTCDKSVVFSETPVSSTNKTEIFLKVAVNTIKLKHG